MTLKDVFKIKDSTARFYQESRKARDHSLADFFHGYLYGRWTYLYIEVATGEHPLARFLKPLFNLVSNLFLEDSERSKTADESGFADTYHGKVVPVEEAENLVTIQEDVCLTNLEKVIPYTAATDIILKNPDRIAVFDCPCRSSRPDPCSPVDVCLIVGEPFVSFVIEHQPNRARLISSQEAVDIIRAEHERGHVQHAFFKDAMLNRFYAICNCCACCCGAFQAHRSGVPMLASSGYLCRIEWELCRGCGICEDTCQFFAIHVLDSKAVVDEDACYGCGVCVDQCEFGAAELVRSAEKGKPLEIRSLLESTGKQAPAEMEQ